MALRPFPRQRPPTVEVAVLAVSVTLTAASLALALRTPDPDGRGELLRYLDVLGEPTLPTWWSTSLLLVAAIAHAVAGASARIAGAPGAGAWFVGAGVLGAFSLTEHSGLHDRLDGAGRQLLGEGPLTATWLVIGAAVAVPVAAVLLAVAARVGPPSQRPIAAGGVLLLVCAVGGELVGDVLLAGVGAGRAAAVAAHLGEFGENVGAVLLLAAATRVLTLTRDGAALRVRHRAADRRDTDVRSTGVEVRAARAWPWLIAVTLALSLLSLTFVLGSGAFGPALWEWRLYVDVLVEANLPTWWSAGLLATAALAHLAVGAAARLAGAPGATCWFVTAAVLAGLSLDDHTQLHERTERLGRLVAPEGGDFPFYWLLPGAVAGLAVAAAVAMLAVRVGERARWMLVGGVAVLLGCALGLEIVQGLFMAAGNQGLGFALSYHVEELGENVAALLLLGAATSSARLGWEGGGLALRYVGGGDRALTDARSPVTGK